MKAGWKFYGSLVLIGVIGWELFYLHRLYDRKDEFLSYCSKKSVDSALCQKMEKSFFFNFLPVQEFKPSVLKAPSLPIDSQIQFVIFHDPRYLSLFAYCFFTYHGEIADKGITPMALALSASGFSIPKVEIKGYDAWLQSEAGRKCASTVHKDLDFEITHLDQSMGDRVAVIAFNPIGMARSGSTWDDVLKEGLRVLTDERAHPVLLSMP